MKHIFIGYITLVIFSGCKLNSDNIGTPENEGAVISDTLDDNWIHLFDGKTTEGWRGYNANVLPPNWVVLDGVLTFDVNRKIDKEYAGGKDIIYAAEKYDNFELHVEWKIPKGGNSGILYHVQEGAEYAGPYEVAPEYQLIDDHNYAEIHDLEAYNKSLGYENPSQLHPLQKTGADYAMYPADENKKKLNPAEEWNTSKIVFTEEKVEHWLNGDMILSFVPWSDDWNQKKENGKWRDNKDYGTFKSGYICLQDHDSPLWFKNIKIKKL